MKRIFWPIAVAAALCGCDSSTPGDEDKYVAFNIVTYEGTTPEGVTTLTYQVIDDSPLLTLSCRWQPNRELATGTRLLVAYSTDYPTESGPVNLLQAALTYGGALEWSNNPDSLASVTTPVWLNSMWRSGHYLNLDCMGRYSTGSRELKLVVDDNTVAESYPVLYLVHRDKSDDMAPYDQHLYASWNVDTLWARSSVQGLKVRLSDSNRGIKELTFNKSVQQ